jgi:hypothetical protein
VETSHSSGYTYYFAGVRCKCHFLISMVRKSCVQWVGPVVRRASGSVSPAGENPGKDRKRGVSYVSVIVLGRYGGRD